MPLLVKTMIFVDKIDNTIQMAKHLRSKLPKHIQIKIRPNHITYMFTLNFTPTLKTKF